RSKRDWSSDVCSSDLAEVEHARVQPAGVLQVFYRGFREHLGVHTRDQHVPRDLHRQPAELPDAGYIGDRLAGKAALHHLLRAAQIGSAPGTESLGRWS